MMGLIIYLNGELLDETDARISVFDHGFLYGDGVFEGIRCYNGRVFRLDEHLDRLYDSARTIMLTIPLGKQQMAAEVCRTVRANGLTDAYVRLVVSRGPGDLGLDPRKCKEPTVLIIASAIQLFPVEMYESGIEIVTVSTRKNRPDALNPNVKSLNYLNNIIAKIEVNRAGLQEALMLNADGYVAEGTGDNIFLVRGGELFTPPTSCGILRGITRQTTIEIARADGVPVHEVLLTLVDVYNADECFLTGTAAEIMPVVRVDGRCVGDGKPGPVTRDITAKFKAIVNSEGTPTGA